mmetsp:Transcript_43309/g.94791  ORF Transcript_43309/g.94791 Transcript_43309/m.94791 type:complete len:206 (+) Transcript_43309:8-625(+)
MSPQRAQRLPSGLKRCSLTTPPRTRMRPCRRCRRCRRRRHVGRRRHRRLDCYQSRGLDRHDHLQAPHHPHALCATTAPESPAATQSPPPQEKIRQQRSPGLKVLSAAPSPRCAATRAARPARSSAAAPQRCSDCARASRHRHRTEKHLRPRSAALRCTSSGAAAPPPSLRGRLLDLSISFSSDSNWLLATRPGRAGADLPPPTNP